MTSKNKYRMWVMVLLAWIVWCGIAIGRSARAGKIDIRQQAEEALAFRFEREINKDYDALGIPYSVESARKGFLPDKRVMVTGKRRFEVEIDSLKEKQSLYPLESMGFKAYMLEYCSSFPLVSIRDGWEEALGGDVLLLLVLTCTLPETDSMHVERAGDLSIERGDCLLGMYYLDDFYTMQLAAYARISFWQCVGWGSPEVSVPLGGGVVLWLAVVVWKLYGRFSRRDTDALAADSREKSVWTLGNLAYDKDSMMLTCGGQRVDMAPQCLKLFCAFLFHGGYLSDEDIFRTLNWNLTDGNLNVKKRHAISNLRGRLAELDRRIQIKHEGKGYKIFINASEQCLDT